MYHPNLFADSGWMSRFCDEYLAQESRFSWRGVTTTVSLRDTQLVRRAGAAGCRELAIGVETINVQDHQTAKSSLRGLDTAAQNCAEAGIKLKALVMAGYPGQTSRSFNDTVSYLTTHGMSVRFTGYTPLHKLRSLSAQELDGILIERFDRRTYYDPESSLDRETLYGALTSNGGYAFPEVDG
jgi:hypothetical protein